MCRKWFAASWGDPTLSFQLKQGFHVLAVVSKYLRNDPESHGYAALIEWLNPDLASDADKQRSRPIWNAADEPGLNPT